MEIMLFFKESKQKRLDTAKKKGLKKEYIAIETIQSETQRGKKSKK